MYDNPQPKILAIILESDAFPPTSELRALEILQEPTIPNPKTIPKQFWPKHQPTPAVKRTANPSAKTKLEIVPAKNRLGRRRAFPLNKTDIKPILSRIRVFFDPPKNPRNPEFACARHLAKKS